LDKASIYLGIVATNEVQALSYEEAKVLARAAAKVFQPRTPITTQELFSGRWNELTTVADAVNQAGLHAVIYGERGVGKTSLANVVSPTIWALDRRDPGRSVGAPDRLVVKTVAGGEDTFSSIWNKLFRELTWANNRATAGFAPTQKDRLTISSVFALPDKLSVDEVRRVLSNMPGAVFIVDEFDRSAKNTSREFTDLIKALSDLAVDCTVVLIGVSDTIDQLISDHASINRALVQVFLPRMAADDLRKILSNAEQQLSIEFSTEAANIIVHVSQGLPHYTHLVGLNAVRTSVLDRSSRRVEREDVFAALKNSVKQAEQSVTNKYVKATHSSHKDALYHQVLLACALTATRYRDALGYFNPAAVIEPLSIVLERKVTIATFNSHLSEFCQVERGAVLERDGQPRAYRFRFSDPLVVPFTFMDAVATGLISNERLSQLLE
jgi:Cdc6-like AAA superfamily ATPase